MLLPLYCMDSLVAWEALSILLPMASTSFPIPLMVLQEARPRAAASVRRASLVFIGGREVESRILPCFRFLVNEPNACRNASFSGHGAFRRGRKWLCRARIRKLCKKSSPGTWRRVIDEGRGAFIHGGIAAWTAAGRRGFFPLG